MISPSCNFGEFISGIKDLDYIDVIYSAEQEATEAERRWYRLKGDTDNLEQEFARYASSLKDFISFLRYGVKPYGLSRKYFDLFLSICEDLAARERARPRCHDLV